MPSLSEVGFLLYRCQCEGSVSAWLGVLAAPVPAVPGCYVDNLLAPNAWKHPFDLKDFKIKTLD